MVPYTFVTDGPDAGLVWSSPVKVWYTKTSNELVLVMESFIKIFCNRNDKLKSGGDSPGSGC